MHHQTRFLYAWRNLGASLAIILVLSTQFTSLLWAETDLPVLAQQAYIKASNTEEGDQFGFSLAISGDTLAVGAFYENSAATGIDGDQGDNSSRAAGAVYVFTRRGTTWDEQPKLLASDGVAGDEFEI